MNSHLNHFYMRHEDYIREAVKLSRANMKRGGGPFGALVVKDGKIIGRSGNTVVPDNDPTAHAEINAIREAADYLNDFSLKECILYTSCEPCPMCLGAIYWARIEKVYYAAGRQDAAYAGFDDSFFYREIGKPPEKRSIPAEQLLRGEALHVLEEWRNSEDKIQY